MLLSLIILYLNYILQSRKTFVFGQFASDDLTIFIKPSNSIVEGANVTIHCQTAKVGEKISLYKNGKKLLETQFGGYNAEFHIYKAVKKDQGNYFCMRQSDSKLSSHIQLTVQVLASDDLTIFIKPSNSIVEGANVTIHCQASKLGEKISLYKNGMKIRETQFDGYNAEFHIYKAVRKDQDNYFCMRQSDSKLSNHIQLTVQDADSAELPVSGDVDYSPSEKIRNVIDYTTGNIVRMTIATALLVLIIILLVEHFLSEKKTNETSHASIEIYCTIV
uniref:Ig-like domain-containing protein n=1 Tax=Leptobrachium leishanense TaxID=445787 RepID=A0A8C5R1Z4_9ANUR